MSSFDPAGGAVASPVRSQANCAAADRYSAIAGGRTAFGFLAAALVACGLAACGFHLRGDVSYAFQSLYISGPAAAPSPANPRALENAA
jgi:hypothetical protein